MLSKYAFVKAIKEIKKMRKLEEGINEAFQQYPDCEISIFPFEASVVELLEDSMEDTTGNIAFWLYDLEMGASCSKDKIGYEGIDTVKYADIHSAEELYDYIVTTKGGI